jgi:DNA polymerase I-like protein with 3'-5' exonuclease and polymerase domains
LQRDYPGIVLLDGDGQPQRTKTGMVRKSTKQLEQQLLRAVEEISRDANLDVAVPRTPKGAVSRSLESWGYLLAQHPFLRLWGELEKLQKRCQFFATLRQPMIHPRYGVLVRTGRTSCSKPNMQQIPREGEFRQVIVPSEGHLLLIVDYAFIELVTLAAVCLARFGFSKLGDVIREGIDPHCYTASMLLDVPLDKFMKWKGGDEKKYKRARDRAKPVNFGVPGGMGTASLVEYAARNYGVNMTAEEAEAFHQKLTRDIYPELASYLSDSSLEDLAQQLRVPASACSDAFCREKESPGPIMGAVRKVVLGQPFKKDGAPYKKHFVRGVWDALNRLNRNPDLADALRRREGSSRLAARLFKTAAVTLTGRVRGGVSYTQGRNTPFQSLASDGAKRALARLVIQGFRVVGFVHDEFLIEMPDQGGYVEEAKVEEVVAIIENAMQELTGSVPVRCEHALSTCWSKNAKSFVEDGRVWAWKPGAA